MFNVFLAFAIQLYNIVNVPVCDMREAPRQDSEIASQAYFSEPVLKIEEKDDWVRIETMVDSYQGWVKKFAIVQKPQSANDVVVTVNRNKAHLYHVEDTVYGPIMSIPFESKLTVLEPKADSDSRWLKVSLPDGQEAYIQRGDVTSQLPLLSRNEISAFSLRFLDLPYTWGGRSSFGYDCSGYVQMLYRQMGIYLPRDAKDQVKWKGFVEVSFDNLTTGDLVFFGPSEDKIRHVGLYLGDNQFIHATVAENMPYIRISKLTDPNWSGSETGRWPYRTARTLKS